MTRKQYLKQVSRRLYLPVEIKQAVLAGLQESFDSAAEHGETDAALMERLGSPKAFVNDVLQSAELTEDQRKNIRRERALRISAIVLSVLVLIIAGLIAARAVAEAIFESMVIGYANAPTEIMVIGGFAPLLLLIFLAALVVCVVVLLLCRFCVKKKLER